MITINHKDNFTEVTTKDNRAEIHKLQGGWAVKIDGRDIPVSNEQEALEVIRNGGQA